MFKVKNTRRNRRSVSPTVNITTTNDTTAITHTFDKNISTFFDAESASAYLKPWLRLERGLRLQRFRLFAEEYPGLTTEERDLLIKVLVKANDAKQLNTKQQIQYDDGKIIAIRGLRMTRVGEAPATFKIDATRPTKKKTKDEESAEK